MSRYIVVLLVAIAIICYSNSIKGQFVWDDINNITNNERLDGPPDLRSIFLRPAGPFYRPIPYLTIYFDYYLWRHNPFGYHLTNILFHIFNAILIFYIAKNLTSSIPISFISSALFAVHPVHTEAVAYISGRSDPICAFFLFGSFYLYLRFLRNGSSSLRATLSEAKGSEAISESAKASPKGIASSSRSFGTPRNDGRVLLAGPLFLFLIGLFSKEIALIFPLIIFCYELSFLKSPLIRGLRRSAPFFLLAVSFLLFRHIFVKGDFLGASLGKFYLLPKFFLFYLKLLIFPFNLHMQHSLLEGGLLFRLPFIAPLVIFTGLIFIIMRLNRDRNISFGLSWFFIGLLPFLGLLKFNSDMAEHWLYFASFGFFFIIGSLLARIGMPQRRIILPVIASFFAILTIGRNLAWRDDISIYKDTIKYNPADHKLHYNLGNAYFRKKLFDHAFKEYSDAVTINPGCAYALNNLGLIIEKRGDLKQAYRLYERANILNPGLKAAKGNLLRFKFVQSAFAQENYFDHAIYGEVLARVVKEGRVDYAALKKDPLKLDTYLERVANLNSEALKTMPRNEKLAFYINVYNAFTLKAVVDNYPVNSIKDIPGVWNKMKFNVAGRELSLSQIEHEILRREFREPRVHFAIVCASIGCPVLRDEPFEVENIYKALGEEAHKFINDKTKVRLDRKKKILYVSSIFKWFKDDFGNVSEFISRYLPKQDAEFIKNKKPRVKYLKYDWSLNERLSS